MAREQETQRDSMLTGVQRSLMPFLFTLVALVILILGLREASSLLAPIFLDGVLAILFTPALRQLERRGLPSPLALLVLALVLVAFLVLMIIILALSLSQLQTRLPVYQTLLIQRTQALVTALAGFGVDIRAALENNIHAGAQLAKTALAAITGALDNLVGIVFFLFTLFLMLAASKGLAQKIRIRGEGGGPFARRFEVYAHQLQKQYRIQTLSNALSALAILIELLLFRVDFALLWGFLAFILGYIPNVGLIIATLPAVLIAFLLYGPGTALAIIALTILLNAIMDNLVTPRFMGQGLNLSMLSIFLSFLVWSWIFGFFGALLAVPATLLIRILFQSHRATQHLAVLLENVSTVPEEEK